MYLVNGDERISNVFYRDVPKCLDRSFECGLIGYIKEYSDQSVVYTQNA